MPRTSKPTRAQLKLLGQMRAGWELYKRHGPGALYVSRPGHCESEVVSWFLFDQLRRAKWIWGRSGGWAGSIWFITPSGLAAIKAAEKEDP